MSSASRAARESALAVVEPELGTLVATGPDRSSWLNGIVSCDVASVTPSQGAWGLALTKQGKIVSDLTIVSGADALFIATAPGTAQELARAFDRMLVMEDAELADRSGELVWVRVHGPRAAELADGAAKSLGAASGAIDWTGLGGAAISVEKLRLAALLELLQQGGAQIGSADDWERLRIERGVPRFGQDFDARDNPHEASLDQRAVSWTKGCYLGQEVVCMQDMRGKVKRRVVALALEGNEPPAVGSPVRADGQDVGEVTSAAFSELGQRAVAQARIKAELADGAGSLSVGGVAATVAERPV
jgi:folate-binding protein YgfZ